MLKVLIADDEMLVRVGVKSTIEWERYGFTVVAEACNGEDALKKIDAHHPDILLTDIRMPKMDGLQLLAEIRRRNLPVETVIMSCYNEFELVRTAMQNGACDYLLKLSLTPQELLEVLERVKEKILSRPAPAGSSSLFDRNDLYDKLVRSVQNGDTPAARLNELAAAASMQLSFDCASLLLLIADPVYEGAASGYPAVDPQTVSMAHNLLRDYLTGRNMGDILILDKNACLFLILLRPDADAADAAKFMQKRLSDYLHLDFSAGLLASLDFAAERLSRLDDRIRQLWDFRFLQGRGSFLSYESADRQRGSSRQVPVPSGITLSGIRGKADLPEIPASISKISGLMRSHSLSRRECLQSFLAAFYQICSMFSTYGGSAGGFRSFCGISFADCIEQLRFLSDAAVLFEEFSRSAAAYLDDCGRRWKSAEILSVLSYVQENLHLPVNLQDAASHVGMSAPYLSTLFKREIGESFTEYLTRQRMERAQTLLEDKNIYIYEVCARVGYTDPNYFCKVFKKYTGMSPEAYRRKRGL